MMTTALLAASLSSLLANGAAITLISNDSTYHFGVHYVPTAFGLANGAIDHIIFDEVNTQAPSGTGTWSVSNGAGAVSTTFDTVNNIIAGSGFEGGDGGLISSDASYQYFSFADRSIASLTFSLSSPANATLTGTSGVNVGSLITVGGQPGVGVMNPGTYNIQWGVVGLGRPPYSFNLSLVPTPEPAVLSCFALVVPMLCRRVRPRLER